jgi:glucose/arabinose dehydrogenase
MTLHRRFLAVALFATAVFAGAAAPGQAQQQEGPAVGLRLVAEDFTSPVALVAAPDGSGRRFVVDQVGVIRVLTADGDLVSEPFLDLRSRIVQLMPDFDERGLLGLAFHPGYAGNGRFFVYYSAPLRAGAPAGYDHTARISEFRVSASNPNQADPASERILLEVDKPQFNHNGGTVAFGPDGALYISIGDGGGADDVGLGHVEDWYLANAGGNGQDIQSNLLGNILRIDVDGGAPYAIPADNPFTGVPGCADGCDEIWAYGLRNPYRMSFDMGGSHDLFVGDAGQELWEEVSIAVRGGNFGWNVKEGAHCFSTDDPGQSPDDCPDTVGAPHPRAGDPLIDPVIEYQNAHNPLGGGLGHVIVGGHVYRGDDLPRFSGDYIFGDWSREEGEPDGSLFVAKPRKAGLWKLQQLQIATSPTRRLGHFLLGFGQDLAGEMYVLTSDEEGPSGTTGRVYRLVRPGG